MLACCAQIPAAALTDGRPRFRQPPGPLEPPPALHRLYVARDSDAAGRHAAERLRQRAPAIDLRELIPVHADFNLDLGAGLAPTACARSSSTSSPRPTVRAFCPRIANPVRSRDSQR
jgi:hypothetical protein